GSEIQFGPTDFVSDKQFVLTFKYDELLRNQVFSESKLKVFYRSAGGWVEQETYIDKTNKELVINTSKLGTYKLGEGSVITSVMPQNFVLNQNYPNPFNPVTEIEFTLANKVPQNTELIVYNSLGQKLNTLFSGKYSFGTFKVRWDGTNSSGQKVSSGVYFYQLVSGDQVVSKKMILIK
ncbi:MAG: FlgD immunoglobulin-like domain containing protein, partial [Calditrichaceae bacterium]